MHIKRVTPHSNIISINFWVHCNRVKNCGINIAFGNQPDDSCKKRNEILKTAAFQTVICVHQLQVGGRVGPCVSVYEGVTKATRLPIFCLFTISRFICNWMRAQNACLFCCFSYFCKQIRWNYVYSVANYWVYNEILRVHEYRANCQTKYQLATSAMPAASKQCK